jgi:hypothetical protein
MTSQYRDAIQTHAYQEFQYHFPEKTLAGRTIIVAGALGAAIFPGDPARVAFENLNRETLLASLESNHVGTILLAKEIGAIMEGSRSLTEQGKCQNTLVS